MSINQDDSIAESQAVILEIMASHEAVLKSPEPLVLVQKLVGPRVILLVYFWIDLTHHRGDKVSSALMRQARNALRNLGRKRPGAAIGDGESGGVVEDRAAETRAEGGLGSDADEIKEQARNSRPVEEGTDLLSGRDESLHSSK